MQLFFNESLAKDYTSLSQKIRILSEDWVARYVFCPNCGASNILKCENNRPVFDFHCAECAEEYELKSKGKNLGNKITDGAFSTMIDRLSSETNPNFFMLIYNKSSFRIKDFLVIPKHFFIPDIVEKRKPLSSTARRSGWVGCNILLKSIPESGKVYYVRNGQIVPKDYIFSTWKKTLFIREQKQQSEKGWLFDIMICIEKIAKSEFTLKELYKYENELSKLHPNNKHVKDKIRQILQVLRDKNYLKFISPGKYRLI